MIIADYHTHTRFSHGKGTIEANVAAAREKGLKEVAITDHGLRHIAFGMRTNDIFKMRKIIDEQNAKYDDINILFGVEANIYCEDGVIDLKKRERGNFDIVLAGFHKGVWPRTFKQLFTFYGRAEKCKYFGPSQADIKYFTNAYTKVIQSGAVDVITHLTYGMPVNVTEVGKAASDYGVFIELNGKNVRMSDEHIEALHKLDTKFIINSDAHTPSRVGDFSVPLEVVERLQIDKARIVNWERLPQFLSYKK